MNNKIVRAVKWLMAVTAFALVVIIFAGLSLGWFKTKDTPTMSENEPAFELTTPDEGGLTASETASNGVSLMSAVIPRSEYAAQAISADAEKAITLTATVTPEAEEYQAVDWSAAFVSATWATGKNVTDYVTVTPKGDLSATVTCKQAFGAQIKVTAACRISPQSTAECTFDYAKKPLELQKPTVFTGVTGAENFGNGDLVSPYVSTDSYYASPKYQGAYTVKTYSSAYTVDDTFTVKQYRQMTANASTEFKKDGKYASQLKITNELGYMKQYEVEQFDATLVGAMILYGADTNTSRSSAPYVATWSDPTDFETWTVELIGLHGTYTFTSKFGFSKSSLQAAVAHVSLGTSSFTF